MTLSDTDVAILTAPFAVADHEFRQGLTYLREEAICDRLDIVDPSWQWGIVEIVHRGDTITVHGRLTVCGVTRDGVGMETIRKAQSGAETNEAENQRQQTR
ncbi:hypothetical protein HC928_01340 [bacterium]|nr:hypothetical protein [bacterium]